MNLPELLDKFARNGATPAEMEAFAAHLAGLDRPAYEQLLETYGELVRATPVTAAPDKTLLATIRQQIEADEQEQHTDAEIIAIKTLIKKKSRWLYYSAAAAVLIAALIGSYFHTNTKPRVMVDVVTNIAIPPGSNKAVLTLSNGQQVLLDDAQQGAVASQGGVKIIKLEKGVVAYRAGATKNNAVEYNTISTPRGGQYQLVLPDGTRAWLNAASSLRFPVAFNGPERKVELTGEGYFDVTQDATHPFIVAYNHTQVQVLGTEFNIKSYDEEPVTRSTLVKGSIRLTRGEEAVLLQPGKMALAATNNLREAVQITTADIEQVTAWKNGKISLTNADLATLMQEISRWYDVNIHYTGAVPDRHFFGLINRNVYLNTILDFLRKNGNVHVVQDGRDITISP